MKRFLLMILLSCVATLGVKGADAMWANYGVVDNPQIDATAVLNAGTLYTSTLLPFETQDTLYFTNRGVINGSIGFRFNFYTNDAFSYGPQPAAVFENLQSITSADLGTSYLGVSGSALATYYAAGSYILVNATNIFSPGTLNAGTYGLIRLEGQNVDVTGGGISASEAAPVPGSISSSIGITTVNGTNYINPSDVMDLHWGIGVNNQLGTSGRPLDLQAFVAGQYPSASYQVLDTSGYTNQWSIPYFGTYYYGTNLYTTNYLSTTNFLTYANTVSTSPTNTTIQAVFVANDVTDTNLSVDVRFGLLGDAGGQQVVVQITMPDIDIVSGRTMTNYLYFTDDSAGQTNSSYFENYFYPTFRPSAYGVQRGYALEWQYGVVGNTVYSPSLLLNPAYTNTVVTNSYSAYRAQIGRDTSSTSTNTTFDSLLGYSVYNPALDDPTNLPGRIELVANNLDLTGARIRSEGLLTITADNLIGSDGVQVDAPIMNINLGSTNGTLVVSNMFGNTVKRLRGQISAYSAVWTNTIATNIITLSNGVPIVTTNSMDVRFQVLILDHTLLTSQSMTASEFIAHATNVIVADNIDVGRRFIIDATNLTVSGDLIMPAGVGATNFVNIVNFTNELSMYIPAEGNWGADRPRPYDNFVNHGMLYGGGMNIRSHYVATVGDPVAYNLLYSITNFFQLTNMALTNFDWTNYNRMISKGRVIALDGAVRVVADDTFISYAQVQANSDLVFSGNNLLANYSTLVAGYIYTYTNAGVPVDYTTPGSIILAYTNSVSDGGVYASNQWQCVGSLQLNARPRSGDLLGTQITTVAPTFANVRHVWAAADRGNNPAGYQDNAAVGWLTLDARNASSFTFAGVGTNACAMYVDYLELKNYATNFYKVLKLAPRMRLYFANANVPVEKLDGEFGGQLVWVRSYAGANSSTNWVSPSGVVYTVNLALRLSEQIDSNGDGNPNKFDRNPFFATTMNLAATGGLVKLAWPTTAGINNVVQYATNLALPTWQTYTNFSLPISGTARIQMDPLAGPQRYYRVQFLSNRP